MYSILKYRKRRKNREEKIVNFFISTQPNATQQNLEILEPARSDPTEPNPTHGFMAISAIL